MTGAICIKKVVHVTFRMHAAMNPAKLGCEQSVIQQIYSQGANVFASDSALSIILDAAAAIKFTNF